VDARVVSEERCIGSLMFGFKWTVHELHVRKAIPRSLIALPISSTGLPEALAAVGRDEDDPLEIQETELFEVPLLGLYQSVERPIWSASMTVFPTTQTFWVSLRQRGSPWLFR